VARRTANDTVRLIEEVARGERLLEDIKDPAMRETVRLALRLHKDPFAAPDAHTRARIRSRVLENLRPRPANIADRIAVAFDILAKPEPYAMRLLAVAAAVVAIAASTMVASAGAVADDALYSVKLASEQARLALATTPEDRAMVELTIAEHRLAEATALATQGNDDDAIVATSEYGEHLANAAAELAQVEAPDGQALVLQLQQKIDSHRAAAAATVAKLSERPDTASAAQVLALVATAGDDTGADADLSPAAAIAAQAATAADEVANVAERKLTPETAEDSDVTRGPDRPRATPGERSRGERAAESARKAADEAKAAAQKAKEGSRRTPQPNRHR
jgi:uncharacterized protein DUF5667